MYILWSFLGSLSDPQDSIRQPDFGGYPFSGSRKIISVALGAPFGHTFGTFWLMFKLGNDMMGALRAFICLISPIFRMTLIIPFSLAAPKHMGNFCESECVYLLGQC